MWKTSSCASYETGTTMEDDTRSKLLSSAFHDVETLVGGHAMRPMSLASYDVMLRTGNPLVKGKVPADGTPEFTAAMLGFVFTHCAPWPEVVRASFDGQAFREAALVFCGALGPADFQAACRALEDQRRQLEAAQVSPAAGTGPKKPRRPTNPAS